MLPSTFVTFVDINTSLPVLGFFQPPSITSFWSRYVPAVGYALLMPAVGYALLTRCGSALLYQL